MAKTRTDGAVGSEPRMYASSSLSPRVSGFKAEPNADELTTATSETEIAGRNRPLENTQKG